MSGTGISLLFALGSFLWIPLLADSPDAFSRFLELESEGKYAEAERVLLGAWQEAERSSPRSPNAAGLCQHLGKFYYERGRRFEAERYFNRALAIWDMQQPAMPVQQAAIVNDLAVIYFEEGRIELVEQLYMKYRPGWLVSLAPDSAEIGRSWSILGSIHYRRGDMVKAEAAYLKALAFPDRVNALNNIGVLYSETGRLDRALECFADILAIEAQRPASNVLVLIHANLNLGTIHCRAKRCDVALSFHDKALQDALNVLGPEHPLTVTAAASYAKLLSILKRKSQARQMDKLVRLLREASPEKVATRQTVDISELQNRTR